MSEKMKELIKESMDWSYLQGKIIILHKLINELKSTVRELEEELEKMGVNNGK